MNSKIQNFKEYALSSETGEIKQWGLSSGSTLLNLAATNNPDYCFVAGKYHFMVGDSSSGKTALSLTSLAEASINPAFDNYRLIYDDVEGGNLFAIEKLFGKKLVDRLEPPAKDKDGPVYSSTTEEFYYNVDNAIKEGIPFIYILDSETGLSSDAEKEKFEETKQAHYKGKTTTGSYGDGKAKKNSSNLRRLMAPLRDSESILIVLSQTRSNISPMSFDTKTRSGGHALRFYASLEMWSSKKGKIKKTIKGKDRQLGIMSKVDIKKNRFTGREPTIEIPIYYSFGIDDVGSCIQYLIDEGVWVKKGAKVSAPVFGFDFKEGEAPFTFEKLAQYIDEDDDRITQLKEVVAETWRDIDKRCQLNRKSRYE